MSAALACLLVAAICWALVEHWLRGNDREQVAALTAALSETEDALLKANALAYANRALAEARNDAMSEYSAKRYAAELELALLKSSARCLPVLGVAS